jgi:hypothetical protein
VVKLGEGKVTEADEFVRPVFGLGMWAPETGTTTVSDEHVELEPL